MLSEQGGGGNWIFREYPAAIYHQGMIPNARGSTSKA